MSRPKIVGPNPEFLRMVKEIMQQNATILRMNSELLKALAAPLMYRMPESPDA